MSEKGLVDKEGREKGSLVLGKEGIERERRLGG